MQQRARGEDYGGVWRDDSYYYYVLLLLLLQRLATIFSTATVATACLLRLGFLLLLPVCRSRLLNREAAAQL